MKTKHALSGQILGLLLLAAGTTTTTSHAALVLDFDSANYNPTTQVWADISGNANHAVGPGPANSPTLTLNATPTGQPAVTFLQGFEYLDLTTHLNGAAFTSSPSFTLLAVVRKAQAAGTELLSGNGLGGAEGIGYILDSNNRQVLSKNNVVNIGSSASASDYTHFHLFGVTYDGTTARFFLDGVADGTAVNSQTFNTGIFDIGIQGGTGAAGFSGDVAAIDVYDTVLSGAALTNAQNALMTTYVPEPGTAALLGMALVGIAAVRRRATAV